MQSALNLFELPAPDGQGAVVVRFGAVGFVRIVHAAARDVEERVAKGALHGGEMIPLAAAQREAHGGDPRVKVEPGQSAAEGRGHLAFGFVDELPEFVPADLFFDGALTADFLVAGVPEFEPRFDDHCVRFCVSLESKISATAGARKRPIGERVQFSLRL